ncbi:hypothetical protein GOV12_04160 [Candidatus Pacearchaeota archaeon]|nr:hypothetical protein [Candidatus Pacearchaeota archaeon]
MNIKTKSWIYGIISIMIVMSINFTVLFLLDFPTMALEIIQKYWILIILLIGGFGTQVGLFTYFKGINTLTCSTTFASGGISATSMILCCSHYILNILPFIGSVIGISGLTVLSKYTLQFLLVGVLSNFIGIFLLFYQSNKHKRNNCK